MSNIIKEICQRRGWSKYKLAKMMGVSWNALHLWDRGVYKPKEENKKKLEKLLNE